MAEVCNTSISVYTLHPLSWFRMRGLHSPERSPPSAPLFSGGEWALGFHFSPPTPITCPIAESKPHPSAAGCESCNPFHSPTLRPQLLLRGNTTEKLMAHLHLSLPVEWGFLSTEVNWGDHSFLPTTECAALKAGNSVLSLLPSQSCDSMSSLSKARSSQPVNRELQPFPKELTSLAKRREKVQFKGASKSVVGKAIYRWMIDSLIP